jgi:parallel beta-helix repeat protein
MKKEIALLIITALAINLHAGKKIVVPKDAPTIEAGLDRADAGDTVFVSKGTYKESIVLKDEVALIGESAEGTVISGNKRGAVVKGADKAIIRNFTIQNGEKGILCEGVSMTIEHNCVCGNKGSGIHCLVTLPMIRNNVVYRNGWTGIFCETVRSIKTLVEHNVVAENGYSGIMLAGNSEVLIQNNVFFRNKQFGLWVNEGARRSRIICNDFYMNRDAYNNYAQVDRTNLAIDPGYSVKSLNKSAAALFSTQAESLKERGKDGKNMGLLSEKEMIQQVLDAEKNKYPSIPAFDQDNDGIPDVRDKCPDLAEDKDGFEDEDGCPDYDNDKDGIPDSADVCPNAPEIRNGYKDEDGCPDQVPPNWKPEPQGSAAPATTDTVKKAIPVDTSKNTVAPDTSKKSATATAAAVDSTKKVKTKKKLIPKPAAVDTAKNAGK